MNWEKQKNACLEDLIIHANAASNAQERKDIIEEWFNDWFYAEKSDRPDNTCGMQLGWAMRRENPWILSTLP
jgi:hypothetical protein